MLTWSRRLIKKLDEYRQIYQHGPRSESGMAIVLPIRRASNGYIFGYRWNNYQVPLSIREILKNHNSKFQPCYINKPFKLKVKIHHLNLLRSLKSKWNYIPLHKITALFWHKSNQCWVKFEIYGQRYTIAWNKAMLSKRLWGSHVNKLDLLEYSSDRTYSWQRKNSSLLPWLQHPTLTNYSVNSSVHSHYKINEITQIYWGNTSNLLNYGTRWHHTLTWIRNAYFCHI